MREGGRDPSGRGYVETCVADTFCPASPPPTVPDQPLVASPAASPGLRTVAHSLGAASAQLYVVAETGGLRLAASEGVPTPDLTGLAETFGPGLTILDVSGIVADVRFAVGRRDGPVALVVLGVALEQLDAAWDAAFADAFALVRALVVPLDAPPPSRAGHHARLLHEVATHPGTFDERLALGLSGLAEALALDAATFARVDDGVWTPEAISDPLGLLPSGPVPVASLPCAMTVYADGPVAMEATDDVGGFPPTVGAYLGAPVFSGGRTVGTLVAVGRAARTVPFTADDRALAESLARWIGAALGGRVAARRLADREAALTAFVDRAPVAMGLTVLDDDGPDDFRFVSVNAAAGRLLGRSAVALAGRLASEVGIGMPALRAWAGAGRHVLAGQTGEAHAPIAVDLDTAHGPRALAVTLGRLDVHDADGVPVACVSFVAEDVTERKQRLRLAAETRRLAEDVADAQAALFEQLHHDLRTPLTTILGYADLLGTASPADEVEAVRDVVLRSGGHLLALLEEAVALAAASRVTLSLVPVFPESVVRSAVEAWQKADRAEGVVVGFQADVSDGPLLMDPALVGRVVDALLGAAVGVPGARHVDVRLAEDGSRLVLDVGVREAEARRPETVSSPIALAERLVERLGGSVDERTDGAARWTVRLPRHGAVVVEMPPEAFSEALAPVGSGAGGGEAAVRAAEGVAA